MARRLIFPVVHITRSNTVWMRIRVKLTMTRSCASLARIGERLESAAAVPAGSACAEMRENLPALVAGKLSGPRTTLLKAHGRECLPCRRAQNEEEARAAGISSVRQVSAASATSSFNWTRFAAAAAVLATAVGLGSLAIRQFVP